MDDTVRTIESDWTILDSTRLLVTNLRSDDMAAARRNLAHMGAVCRDR
jgi:hypothetical protein